MRLTRKRRKLIKRRNELLSAHQPLLTEALTIQKRAEQELAEVEAKRLPIAHELQAVLNELGEGGE